VIAPVGVEQSRLVAVVVNLPGLFAPRRAEGAFVSNRLPNTPKGCFVCLPGHTLLVVDEERKNLAGC
jgi:hypothetical protein